MRSALRFFRALGLALAWSVGWVGVGHLAAAADSVPVFGPGATKEEIINAYGWPTGQSQAGNKEILTYPQGRITLENGKVERMDFLPNVPWPAPRARPAPATPTTVKKAEAPVDFWLTDFEQARREAAGRNARILALFIGSDWSPPSRQFQDEVAFHPDFVNAFTGDFVFLRLDFPNRAAQSTALREQNLALRTKYGVTTYPSLVVLTPAGTAVAVVDLSKPPAGDTYRARVIAAVAATRDQLLVNPPAADATPASGGTPPPSSPAVASKPPEPLHHAGTASVSAATPLVIGAVASGLGLAAIAFFFLWRRRSPSGGERHSALADRIANAAAGLPTADEIHDWDRNRLCTVFAGMVETDGYEVTWRAGGADADLALVAKGDTAPSIVVCVQPGAEGPISAKKLKELFGTVTLEGVAKGWAVAPAGFSSEAKAYAESRPLVLLDSADLLAQMRGLPELKMKAILGARKT